MTIAMCYLTREGVVLGADSTTSFVGAGFHYFNHNQKLFEVGEDGTLGLLTWGLGGLTEVSYRTLIANLADDLTVAPPGSVAEASQRWIDAFADSYFKSSLVLACQTLHAKPAFAPGVVPPDPLARTREEQDAYDLLKDSLVVGFCIGGHVTSDRTPHAFSVTFDPLAPKPAHVAVPLGQYRFWGAPNMIARLIHGFDFGLRDAILNSGHWTGAPAELDKLLFEQFLAHPILPIREAVDFVHACIYSTIKALKFSNFSQICGGPIEIATITTDRRFRWVRHKSWDAAVIEGER
jgi:hypothetical protein